MERAHFGVSHSAVGAVDCGMSAMRRGSEMVDLLDDVAGQVRTCDVADLDAADLALGMGAARILERTLAGLTSRLALRAEVLKDNASPAEESGPGACELLRGQGAVTERTARAETTRAKTVSELPILGDALNAGDTSGEHVDIVARAMRGMNPRERESFKTCEARLAVAASRMPAETFQDKVRRLAEHAKGDRGRRTAAEARAASQVKMWIDREGMGRIAGSFDLERWETLQTAIDSRMASLCAQASAAGDGLTKNENLAATALCHLVDGGLRSDSAAGRAHISVVVDAETLMNGFHRGTVCETGDGHDLNPDAAARLFCDAVVQRVVVDGESGLPLDVGRRRRTATEAQWTALRAIYKSCAMCSAPLRWCQAHHIVEWGNGGSTSLDNLVPLCSRHHHAVHEGGWSISLDADRGLTVVRPDGVHHESRWPSRRQRDLAHEPDNERRQQIDGMTRPSVPESPGCQPKRLASS